MKWKAHTTPTGRTVMVDEDFIPEWVGQGLTRFGPYLDAHARFADYLDEQAPTVEAGRDRIADLADGGVERFAGYLEAQAAFAAFLDARQ